jgi:hypothetical protein
MSRETSGSHTWVDQIEYERGETAMGEIGEDVPIGDGDDEPVKDDVQTR